MTSSHRMRSALITAALLGAGLAGPGFLDAPLTAQQAPPVQPARGPTAMRALRAGELSALQLWTGSAQRLQVPERADGRVEVALRIQGTDEILRLRPHSVRAPDMVVRVQDAAGSWRVHTPPPVATVRGEIVGRPGSRVTGTLSGGRLTALVQRDAEAPFWAVQPLPDAADSGEHAVYAADDVVDVGAACQALPAPFSQPPPVTVATEASASRVCEIAIDTDAEYFALNGSSVEATVSDVEDIINGMEALYLAGAGISYSLTEVVVRTDAADPYDSTDSLAQLIELRQEWNAHHGDAERDIAHLFTGKELDGSIIGRAYIGVMCSSDSGYGISQSRFSANFSARVALTAHEVGHNWNAPHCNGEFDCNVMCSGLGGCAGDLSRFGTTASLAIAAARSAAPCLSEGAIPEGPAIDTITPAFGPACGDRLVVLSGGPFVDDPATTVRFDGAPAEILSITDDTLTLITPEGVGGRRVDVIVDGPTGTTLLADVYTFEWHINPGDQGQAAIGVDDIDRAYFAGTAGTELRAEVRRKGKSNEPRIVPGLRLRGPNGSVLITVEDDPLKPKHRARFTKLVLPTTGTYTLEIYGVDGSIGGYRLTTRARLFRRLKQSVGIGPSTPVATVSFGALPDTTLRSLQFKARKAKGDFATIEGLPAALLPRLAGVWGPDGPVDFVGFMTVNSKADQVRLKNVPLDGFGDYELILGSEAASVGYGEVRLSLKPPKLKRVKHTAEPEAD